MQLSQAESSVGICDFAKRAAGADRRELLMISDQSYARTRPIAKWRAVSRDKVSAIAASSMITKVVGPTAATHSERSPWSRDQVSLARVSVRIPVCSARTAAAADDGARPTS